MKATLKRTRAVMTHTLVLALGFGVQASAQSTKVSGTLRHGSGLLDIPVASVLPHGTLTGTYSGFWTRNDTDYSVDDEGRITGTEPFSGSWNGDLAAVLGLFDVLEVGASLQSLEGSEGGGPLWAAFGRLSLLNPQARGLGLAVGGRYLTSPDFGDGVDYAPTRLGRADPRVRDRLGGSRIDTEESFYVVAGADLAGLGWSFLPEYDVTLSAGWGTGLFREGDGLDWHEFADSEGWFAGVAWHLRVGRGKLLAFMTEYNGFDWNIGGELDLGGVALGAHVLGVNYSADASVYRSSKFGLKASVTLCGARLCPAALRERPVGRVVVLPAPPPDTVVVSSPLPEGTPRTLCLATGEAVEVLTTEDGTILVGPRRYALEELRPAMDFAGTYADGRSWFESEEPIRVEGRDFMPSPRRVGVRCEEIRRIAEHMGVPLFGGRDDRPPWRVVYVPVRPGIWQAYDPGR